MSITAMKQALEALEKLAKYENPCTKIQVRTKDGGSIVTMYPHKVAKDAADILSQAIAEAEKQEPFGYFKYAMHFDAWVQNRDSNQGVAFYTHPPRREWVGLTDEEIGTPSEPIQPNEALMFARVIESLLKEKNQ